MNDYPIFTGKALTMTELELIVTGRSAQHIDSALGIHYELLAPWQKLRAAGAEQGFDLSIASGFRSFDRQLAIWNAKCLGERPVLDSDSRAIDVDSISPFDKVMAILRWSALPGASRHHWGSDIDIFDAAAVESDYALGLVPSEYQVGGPFAPMTDWLDAWLSSSDNPGFFKPYLRDTGGVNPEPWHLSYQPIARIYQQSLTAELLVRCLAGVDIQEHAVLTEYMELIVERFIKVEQA